ncbi:methyltransferase domain-containing protein [Candidatus Poriferisodalis sp.]|uniref:class I SAM-dependent methyltransferase n=1 Tax=Candidatus Poriferisodalis sp. TaxID=3101277 RepID=UPI003B52A4E6
MLTVDYERLGARRGDRVLDLGCGAGRHAFESVRRGCVTVASDRDADELRAVTEMFAAMAEAGEFDAPSAEKACADAPDRSSAAPGALGGSIDGQDSISHAVVADATALPYPDASFDRIIAAEVLEHIVNDERAIAELSRVLRPGGTIAVTVPAAAAERVCWALSADYHAPAVPDGHVRIYSSAELRAKLAAAGLDVSDSHGAHGLHTPYWWLRCMVGPRNDTNPLVRAYHRLLVWDMTAAPPLTRMLDRLLNAVLPKSTVLYAYKARASETPQPLAEPVGAAHAA